MKHIAIFGPTAVGKTKLSIKLAKHLNTEIISADSAQIYKYLNIGSAKITLQQMDGIKHHMIDLLNPGDAFNTFQFASMSSHVISKLEKDNKCVIVVGGTGLYLKSLTDGLVSLPSDTKIREQLQKEDPQFLHDRLMEIDIDYAKRIPPNNVRRIIRALEVYELTGKPFTYFHKSSNPNFSFFKFGLTKDRTRLYQDINDRVDQMFEIGLLEEAKEIYTKFKNKIDKINIIGYRELFSHFNGVTTLEEAKAMIKQNSRNYAKRQITWMNWNNFEIIDVDTTNALEYILNRIE